ncbi:DUF5794 domain-containing protein [Halobacteriaceae archaeon GCM10025711]
MSSSQHPIALRLERQVGGATKLLMTVMALPLIDGIFPALVLAGAVDGIFGMVQVGLLVFGGSATVAVILAEMESNPREQLVSVATVGVVLVTVAAVEAAMAPTIESVLDLVIFERFAGLVIAAIAAKTASARIGEYLPRPAVIIGLGMIASFDPAGAQLKTMVDTTLILHAVGAAVIGVAFAMSIVVFQQYLEDLMDIDRFRFGSAVALGVLALAILGGPVAQGAPLAVLVVAGLLAFDPGAVDDVDSEPSSSQAPAGASSAATDGGNDAPEQAYGYPSESDSKERAPWL